MEKDKEKTLVVFRRWPKSDGKTVLALFPEVEHRWPYCSSYEHVGQHGGADYRSCIARTNPVLLTVGGLPFEDDARRLYDELEGIGYNLKVRRKYIHRRRG